MWLDEFTAGELGSEKRDWRSNLGRCYSWVSIEPLTATLERVLSSRWFSSDRK